MKDGWQIKTLAEICQIRPPKSEAREKVAAGALVSFAPMEDLGIDRKSLNPTQLRSFATVAGSYTYFADGDVLLAKITPCFENGKLGIATGLSNGIGFGSSEFMVFRPYSGLDNEYLYYYLSRADFREEGAARMGGAVGQQRVAKEFIESYPIHFPPLPEQRRIVGILDEAFGGIAIAKANAKKSLQNARELFESYLQSVFTKRGDGWAEKPLAELCDPSRVITYGVIKLGDEQPDGVPCLRTSNVRWLRIETDGLKRIAPSLSAEYSRTILKGGEVLVNVRGTLGGVAVVEPEMAGWNVSREVAVVPVASSRINPVFLSYLIGSGVSQQWLGGVKKGAAYVGINIEDLRLLPVSVPRLNEQSKIVTHLNTLREETQRLATLYERKVAALDELKESLLHQAFTGELTSQVSVQSASVVPVWPVELKTVGTTDLHAGILAMAYDLHEGAKKQVYFGHVKGEKIAHMIEARLGISLGRSPVKDAAGPNDFPHLQRVEHRARKAGFFDFKRSNAGAYQVQKLRGFSRLVEKIKIALGERLGEVERLLQWMLPMTMQQAEIVATVYAGWNNLLLDGKQPTDEEIVWESRENWHDAKLKIEREKFFTAIKWLRKENVVPEGRGRRVSKKGK
jgi:type I restriction enzyme S subunit